MKERFLNNIKRLLLPVFEKLESDLEVRINNEAVSQKVLMNQYRELAARFPARLPGLDDVGFRKYSQFEEDGILLYIFSVLPPLNRTCVEICAGNGRECNTTNLIINHGWWGYLFDGNEQNVKDGAAFFSRCKDTFLHPPRFTHAWITAENVNREIADSGVRGPVDLLSLDMDGMDYWIWKSISVIEPRVVVCETSNPIPPDEALTAPYDPGFVVESEDFLGASLAAMVKLGREKGYRLVGTHRYGFNAFFIREGLAEETFPEVECANCVKDPFSTLARKERWPKASKYAWQKV